jgi:hypothetical protein
VSAVVKDADRVRAVIAASSEPLTAAQIAAQIDDLGQQVVAARLYDMHKAGRLVRVTNEETGRYAYSINPEHTPARRGPKPRIAAAAVAPAPKADNPVAIEKRFAARGAKAKPAAPARKAASTYQLYDHITAALQDLDELVGDAIDHDAPRDALKEVWAAQGALRRAQGACLAARGVS